MNEPHIVPSVEKKKDTNGQTYDVFYDMLKGDSDIRADAKGREYWIQRDPDQPFFNKPFFHIVDADRRRLDDDLYVEALDEVVQYSDTVVTCTHSCEASDAPSVICTNMAGCEIGNFPVPEGAGPLDDWLPPLVLASIERRPYTRLRLADGAGALVWTQPQVMWVRSYSDETAFPPPGVRSEARKRKGANGETYDVFFTGVRDISIHPEACGREYWIQTQVGKPFYGVRYFHVCNSRRKRCDRNLYVEERDETISWRRNYDDPDAEPPRGLRTYRKHRKHDD